MEKQTLRVLSEFAYTVPAIERGYTGQTLYVNVGDGTMTAKPVTEDMKAKFTGGRGFDLWLLWQGVNDDTRWDSPENEIVIASGPCGGITQYPGSGKSIAASISPLTEVVIDSNAGGHFGPYLKFAGWDAIEVQGKVGADLASALADVIVYIDGPAGVVQIIEAPDDCPTDTYALGPWLLDHFAPDDKDKPFVSFVTAGRGAEHALMGCLNFSLYDRRRKALRYKQAGRGGIGTVLRDKKIKALVVHTPPFKGDTNDPADLDRLTQTGTEMRKEITTYDSEQNRMRNRGTSYLVQIMDDYDLLPVYNFRYGSHPDTPKINGDVWEARYTQGLPDGCWYGCTMACAHAVDNYKARTGPYKGHCVIVDGPEYETIAGVGSNCGIFEPWAVLEINFYCDAYGIDTISFGTAMAFVMECYEAGVLDLEKTGGLDLHPGNAEAALEVLHQMARGEGFGLIFGQGTKRMKRYFAEHFGADPQFVNDIGMEAKGLEYSEYIPKESLAQQGGYGLTNKGPQHDEAWLIFMDQVNNQ
ncbi:MAG: aldehyde ferredoxin oxidoreductase C-terminal domain-containing protein, partial [Anaerolineae bacterium]